MAGSGTKIAGIDKNMSLLLAHAFVATIILFSIKNKIAILQGPCKNRHFERSLRDQNRATHEKGQRK